MPQGSKHSQIGIALVEDDVFFQRSLKEVIDSTSDMVLLKQARTRAQGLQLLEDLPVDVLIVDLGLPDGSGIDVISAAHEKWPACNIMVSTTFGDELHVMQSLEAGAAGYLLKDGEPKNLAIEIRNLFEGGSPISPMIARHILMRFRADHPFVPSAVSGKTNSPLSLREREVLDFITKGFTTDEIAEIMCVSRHTVLTFIRRIYAKLQVNSKAEAIYEARRQGLLKV
ncbi:MAG: response regulator transcription factor [Sideroxydans sp.]|nr:response regulator transcription factor [Sideroxydans sp.]NOT99685.1 response regulator transcription factor [Sideroxydans sp.]